MEVLMNKNENYLEQILKQILFTAVLVIAILYAPIGHFEKKTVSKAYDTPKYETICSFPDGHIYYNEEKTISHSKYSGLGYHKKIVRNGTEHHAAVKKTVWVWGW